MSKKLYFLMSFVLALSLSGLAQADAIDINNHSFEYDVDGNQIEELTGWDDVKGWTMRDNTFTDPPTVGEGFMGGYQFVDVEWGLEGFEAADGTVCSFNVTADDPNDPNFSCQIIQILEDPNAVIAENRRYTLTFNALRLDVEEIPLVYGALFYTTGVNVVPVNDVTLASKMPFLTSPPWGESDYAGWEEVTVSYTALPSAGSLGETLGIKLSAPIPWLDGYEVAIDNVRMDWVWATDAWNPSPADGADDVPIVVNLSWSPGLWAVDVNAHEVYFGTDEAAVEAADRFDETGIFRGPQNRDVNSYTPTEIPLELGKTYYWRVDEVNEAYAGPPAAAPDANGRWKGDIWSFRTTGLAYDVYPADWATGVPALNLLLRWAAGTDSNSHDVYFGTDKADVTDANTSNTALYPGVFRGNQSLADANYALEDLGISKTYYWRIDEVNEITGTFVKGDVWRFTTGVFLNVDTFNSYVDNAALEAVWTPANLADLFIEKDIDYVRDGNSMKFTYMTYKSAGKFPGSEAVAALPLEVGTDWRVGGGKALVLYFFGDPFNGKDHNSGYEYSISQDQMYVAVEDGNANVGIVEYDDIAKGYDMNDIKKDEWHEWNIELADPCLAAVDMNNVAKVYIGFGGEKTGQTSAGAGHKSYADTVWFDDIRLYPPRCMPSFMAENYLHDLGDFDSDCLIGFSDLDIMASDWNMRGQWALAAAPAEPPEVWYRFDDGPGTKVVKNDGSWGSAYNIDINSPNEVDEPNWTDAAPAVDPCDPCYALDFDGTDDKLEIPNSAPAPNQFVGTQNMTMSAWIKPDGNVIPWETIIESRKADDETQASGMGIGAYYLDYWWNNDYWDWWSVLWPYPNVWSFVAVAVEPTKAALYLSDGTSLEAATHIAEHEALDDWDTDRKNLIAQNTSNTNPDNWIYFKGKIDDVRLYNRTLTVGEIMGIAGVEGMAYVPLNSVADLVVGIKDPNDPNAPIDDQIDFRDYGIMAGHWLEYEQHLWP